MRKNNITASPFWQHLPAMISPSELGTVYDTVMYLEDVDTLLGMLKTANIR